MIEYNNIHNNNNKNIGVENYDVLITNVHKVFFYITPEAIDCTINTFYTVQFV